MSFPKIQHPRFVFSLLLCAVIVYLYSFSLGHNFLFDEDDIILKNPVIRDVGRLPELLTSGFFQKLPGMQANWEQYYRPVPLFTFMLDFQIWKTNPLGYNLTNTFLQCLVVLLLFRFLLKIFPREYGAAFLSSLLFAVHPIHTEAVTYIASRGDVMAGLFMLAGMLLYWDSKRLGALICYTVALFCKESALLFPIYLLLMEISVMHPVEAPPACRQAGLLGAKPLRGPAPHLQMIKKILPFLIVAILYLIFRKTICPIPMGPPTFDPQAALLRFLSMGQPFLNYWQALIFPEAFKFCQQVEFAVSLGDTRVWTTLAVLGALLAGWVLTLRRWNENSHSRRAGFFGLTLFFIALAPSMQIIHFFPEWAEHYLYFPSIGLTVLSVCFFRQLFQTRKTKVIALFFALYIPFILFLGFRTAERNRHYSDTKKFYEMLSESDSPYAYYGFINLGLLEVVNGSWDKAFVSLKTAYLINPQSETNNYNLGLFYMIKMKYEKAHFYFKAAYESPSGNHQPMHQMRMGQCLVQQENYSEAIRIYEEVQTKMPESGLIYKHLARAYGLTGDAKTALEWIQKGQTLVDVRTVDHSSLLMEEILLAYLNDWPDVQDGGVDKLLQKSGMREGQDWYWDSARLLKGILTVKEYQRIVARYFPYNHDNASYLILISHVSQKRWAELTYFIEENRANYEKNSSDPVFTKMIFDRAQKEMHENPKAV